MVSDNEKKVAMENLRSAVLEDLQIQKRNRRYLILLTSVVILFVVWTLMHPAPATIKALSELHRLHEQLDSERAALNVREDHVIQMQQTVLNELIEIKRIDSIRKDTHDSLFHSIEPFNK